MSNISPVTQRSAFKAAVQRLKEAGIDSPILDARLLIQHALGVDWATLFTGADYELSPTQQESVEAALQRRLHREPVSRIIGKRAFWKFELAVSPATLDPRPDTEALILSVLKRLPDPLTPLSILDLGTGSGAILLALLTELPNATGLGIDISADAIKIAEANAAMLGLTERATFMAKDWGHGLEGAYDLIVSNPPYIKTSDIETLEPEVKHHDPRAALDGGESGFESHYAIMDIVPGLLTPKGLVAIEIGQGQNEKMGRLFDKVGLVDVQIHTDLGKIDRVVTGIKPN